MEENLKLFFARAMQRSIPVLMGYVPLGMAFAVYWSQQGLPWWGAVLASLILYAGSMQFLLVGLFVSGVDLSAIAFAALAVNLRHAFYGLSYPVHAFAGHPLALSYAVFSLTDEAYSLVSQYDKHTDYREILILQALCHSYWLLGTALGLALGALLPPYVVGFDFALAALFAVLAQNHYYHRERRPLLLIGAVAIGIALACVQLGWLGARQTLAVAIAALLVMLFFLPRERFQGKAP